MQIWENESFELDQTDIEFLQRHCGGLLERRIDGWAVTRLVGHISLPSGEILHIKSRKASAASLLGWLCYAGPTFSALRLLGRLPKVTDEGPLSAIVARLFLQETLRAANQCGLIRNYQRRRVFSINVRGRIDFQKLIHRGGDLSKLPCITWERVPHTPLNRFLSAAVKKIRSDQTMRIACRTDMPKARALFDGVQPMIDPRIMEGKEPLARNERPFETTRTLARLILGQAWLREGRKLPGESFLINLESLFERTVFKAFREAGVDVTFKAPVRYTRIHTKNDKAVSSKICMEMDLFLPNLKDGPVVVDSKYKTNLSSANLQQMVTYCFAAGANRAVLVFPEGFPFSQEEKQTCIFECPSRVNGEKDTIRIDVVQLETGAKDLAGWRSAATKLAHDVLSTNSHREGV